MSRKYNYKVKRSQKVEYKYVLVMLLKNIKELAKKLGDFEMCPYKFSFDPFF